MLLADNGVKATGIVTRDCVQVSFTVSPPKKYHATLQPTGIQNKPFISAQDALGIVKATWYWTRVRLAIFANLGLESCRWVEA